MYTAMHGRNGAKNLPEVCSITAFSVSQAKNGDLSNYKSVFKRHDHLPGNLKHKMLKIKILWWLYTNFKAKLYDTYKVHLSNEYKKVLNQEMGNWSEESMQMRIEYV